jgi:hypothetical protein
MEGMTMIRLIRSRRRTTPTKRIGAVSDPMPRIRWYG